MEKFEILDLKEIKDSRGCLVALEELINIPFEIKRVYYIYNTNNASPRGFHAHKKLKQVLICLKGSVDVVMDNGKSRINFLLDTPNKGLAIYPGVWRELLNCSEDMVLMVLADRYYDENDYIRDYEEYQKFIQKEVLI